MSSCFKTVFLCLGITGLANTLLTHLGFVFAALALECVVAQVSDGDEATEIAHVDAVRVGHFEQPLSQELSRSMGDLTVSLHLPKTQTSIPADNGIIQLMTFLP